MDKGCPRRPRCPRSKNCPRSANRQGDSMTARVSGLMTRLKVDGRLDNGKVAATQLGQDYGKVSGFCQPLKKAEIGERLLRNVEVAETGSISKILGNTGVSSSVTRLVTTPAAPVVARREVAMLVSTESPPPAANDPDRRASAVALSSCGQCAMHRAPGAARPGYCIGRDDLPLAYGLLHVLPGDLGDGCPEYRPRGGPDKT